MQETGSNIKPTQSITDDSFRKDIPEAYNLFIFIDDDELSAVVSEHDEKRFVAMESWEFDNNTPLSTSNLESTITESEFLRIKGYRQVICCSAFRCSSLVPAALFDQHSVQDQLRFAYGEFEPGEILTDTLHQVEARNVYDVPLHIYKIITSNFKNVSFHHTSTALIEYLLSANRNSSEELMTINVHTSYIEIIVIKGKKLVLYNTYSYSSNEEMVYYMLFVCEQLHLNPDSIDVQFAGKITNTDSAYSLASKYLRNIMMVNRPDNYSYSYIFNRVPGHLHFNLLSQLICAS